MVSDKMNMVLDEWRSKAKYVPWDKLCSNSTAASVYIDKPKYSLKPTSMVDIEKFKRDYDNFQKSLDAMDRIAKENKALLDDVIAKHEKEKETMDRSCGTCKYMRTVCPDCYECMRTIDHINWKPLTKVSMKSTIEIDMSPAVKDVIFNPPATIVFWKDGTKTVVKADGEEFDAEKGLAMAFSKKFLGNKYEYYNTFKHWLKRAPGYKKEK